ncbi:hypothetical protein RUM44_009811 [Polyplax serrata]|uniref:Uncharacterized protein n=1 Tax=Polyplax serrata TaxID=468196 RepID=A0ABR1ATR5_POLSC
MFRTLWLTLPLELNVQRLKVSHSCVRRLIIRPHRISDKSYDCTWNKAVKLYESQKWFPNGFEVIYAHRPTWYTTFAFIMLHCNTIGLCFFVYKYCTQDEVSDKDNEKDKENENQNLMTEFETVNKDIIENDNLINSEEQFGKEFFKIEFGNMTLLFAYTVFVYVCLTRQVKTILRRKNEFKTVTYGLLGSWRPTIVNHGQHEYVPKGNLPICTLKNRSVILFKENFILEKDYYKVCKVTHQS